MNEKHVLELLNIYSIMYKDEKAEVDKIKDFINKGNCFNKYNKIGHITASAFIVDYKKENTLLTYHKKLNKWLQLGGHIEICDISIYQSALREAYEESSLNSLCFVSKDIFDIDIHLINYKLGNSHYHFDLRFLLKADIYENFKISNESINLKWINLNTLDKYNPNWSMLKMRQKIVRHFQDKNV